MLGLIVIDITAFWPLLSLYRSESSLTCWLHTREITFHNEVDLIQSVWRLRNQTGSSREQKLLPQDYISTTAQVSSLPHIFWTCQLYKSIGWFSKMSIFLCICMFLSLVRPSSPIKEKRIVWNKLNQEYKRLVNKTALTYIKRDLKTEGYPMFMRWQAS